MRFFVDVLYLGFQEYQQLQDSGRAQRQQVLLFVCLCVCVFVYVDGWMDGWMNRGNTRLLARSVAWLNGCLVVWFLDFR